MLLSIGEQMGLLLEILLQYLPSQEHMLPPRASTTYGPGLTAQPARILSLPDVFVLSAAVVTLKEGVAHGEKSVISC